MANSTYLAAEREALDRLRKDSSSIKSGLHRGRVESIDDPDRLGRCKIRVWSIHGDEHRTPTSALPWAEVAELGGGGYDYGSFLPPVVGSDIWVGFENGNEDFPVILGTFRGRPVRNDENPRIMLTKDNLPRSETSWLPPDDENESPKDIFDGVHNGDPHPTRRVLYKSYKGFTIMIEEGDGKEYMKIIDRAGQTIMFDCPVEKNIASGNKAQRGVRDSIRGDQMPHEAMVNRKSSIRIRDLSGQEIVLESVDQNECILIKSKSRDGSSNNQIRLFSGKGKDRIEITDTLGDELVFDPHSVKPIVIRDSLGSSIYFDKEKQSIGISADKLSEVSAKQQRIEIDGKSESVIKGDSVDTIHGNSKHTVLNDNILGILGNTKIAQGGAIKLVVTNASPSGKEDNAIDIQIAQPDGGNFSLKNSNGDMSVSTMLGKLLLETIEGDANLRTELGNILIESLSGNVTLKSESGDAVVEGGNNTYLGEEGASENVMCGKLWTSWVTDVLNGLITHTHSTAVGPSTPPVVGLAQFTQALATVTSGANNSANPLSKTVFTTKEKS